MIKVRGAEALAKSLADLDKKLTRKVSRKSLRAGAKVIQAESKQNAPVKSGKTKKAIKIRAKKSRKKGVVGVSVGVGEKWFTGDEFYAAFVEFGHKIGSRSLGDARAEVPGVHFIEKAYDSKKDAALAKVISSLGELVTGAGKQ